MKSFAEWISIKEAAPVNNKTIMPSFDDDVTELPPAQQNKTIVASPPTGQLGYTPTALTDPTQRDITKPIAPAVTASQPIPQGGKPSREAKLAMLAQRTQPGLDYHTALKQGKQMALANFKKSVETLGAQHPNVMDFYANHQLDQDMLEPMNKIMSYKKK